MKILIVGSGGREYSIGLSLKNDDEVKEIFFAPGNGATSFLGTNLEITDFNELANFAKQNDINLTIVGPEDPLVGGIVDVFESRGLAIFGPSKNAARLEGSKAFMKDFLSRHNIPTARYIQTSNLSEATNFIQKLSLPIVVKADGLCAGKGVIIAKTKDEAINAAKDMLSGTSFKDAGKNIVVEEFLDGYELSIFAICDGKNYVVLPAAQDHKRLLDNDEGPNTGGMGAYVPTPLVDDKLYKQVEENVIKPTLKGMSDEGSPFCGVLFIGLMIVNKKAYVLEYNVRFGDPECEVLMPILKTPLKDILLAATKHELDKIQVKTNDIFALAVVMASENYPFSSSADALISVKKEVKNAHIVYAGVKQKDGQLYASGGRVLLCVGVGKSVKEARKSAYELCENVSFRGAKFRKDIAYLAMRE